MTSEHDTISLVFDAYEERTQDTPPQLTGKWIGVAILAGDPIVWSQPANDKWGAIRRAKRAFWDALYCSHTFTYSHDDHEQNQHTGRDYMVKVFTCTKCGLRDTHEIEEED